MSGLRSRLLVGAIAGVVGTAAMTAAMRRAHRHLPKAERYPLPPREIVERTVDLRRESAAQDATLLSHFGFGAGAGALMTASRIPGPLLGTGWGAAVWLGSYLGWVPASSVLRPASSHPWRRNLLMMAVHLIWGSVTAATARELETARRTAFSGGELRDAPD